MPKLRSPGGRVVSVSEKGVEAMLARGYTAVGAERETYQPAESTEPARSAVKADWVAYADSQGAENPADLTKAELVERYGTEEG